tara:strand:- start:167 stop:301 length:135 start_codon:yes stop_codon:yes gene_type:complete
LEQHLNLFIKQINLFEVIQSVVNLLVVVVALEMDLVEQLVEKVE